MIAPRTIADMLAASPMAATSEAIVATLKRQILGVTVVAHPGKLDINDVVAKAVVAAPGIAVGWTATRAVARPGGTYDMLVDWVAYVVVEDYAIREENRAVKREALGPAIAGTILEILGDPDLSAWGLTGVDRPQLDPGPQFVPMFTARSFEAGTAYYAVTWRQALLDQGTPLFGEPRVAGRIGEDGMAEVDFDEEDMPTEVLAWVGERSGA